MKCDLMASVLLKCQYSTVLANFDTYSGWHGSYFLWCGLDCGKGSANSSAK